MDKKVNSISIVSETYDKELQQANTNASDAITANNQSNFLSVIAPPRPNKHNFDASFFQQSILQSGINMSNLSPSEMMKKYMAASQISTGDNFPHVRIV